LAEISTRQKVEQKPLFLLVKEFLSSFLRRIFASKSPSDRVFGAESAENLRTFPRDFLDNEKSEKTQAKLTDQGNRCVNALDFGPWRGMRR
jgi:hypothetical protein